MNRAGHPVSILAHTLLIAAITIPTLAQSTPKADWPHWGGPLRNASSPETGIFDHPFELQELWRQSIDFGISALVIAEGRVFSIMTAEAGDDLFALHADTGEYLWRVPLGKGPAGQEEFGSATTPATDGSMVFVLSSTCNLEARSVQDGAKIWSHDIRSEYQTGALRNGCWSSPLLDDDRLILQVNGEPDKRVMAFEKSTGEVLWTSQGVARAVRSSIALGELAGRRQLLVHDIIRTRQGGVYGLDAKDGALLWSVRFEPIDSFSYDAPIVMAEDQVAQLTWNAMHTFRIHRSGDTFESKLAWSGNDIKAGALPVNIHAVVHGQYLYGFDQDNLVCLRAATGEVLWKRKIYQGSLILVDGHLVVLSQAAGLLRVVEATPEAYHEKAAIEILAPGAATDTPPSFAAGRIYLRNSEEVVAVEVNHPEVNHPEALKHP